MSTFSQLIDQYRVSGIPLGRPPVSYGRVAKRCKISRQFLYDLMNGDKTPSEHVIERITKVLGVRKSVVQRALEASELVGR